jgi:glycosyltransferase involved in cell wall biosynthesis
MTGGSPGADPEVSIVIPTRDRLRLVVRAVASTLAQTIPDVEVLVVDDGSTEPVRLEGDGRVRVLRQAQRRGPCAARNLAMAAARGRWVTFLDDDDELEPDMLEVSLAAARESNLPRPVAVLSGIDVVGNDGRVLQRRLPVTLPKGRRYSLEDDQGRSFVTHNTLVAPLEVLRSIGGWDETLPAWEHDDLFLRLNAVCSIQGVDTVTYRMTASASVRLSRDPLARAVGIECTLAKHPVAFAANRDRHAYLLGALGLAYLRAGRWGPAVAATSRSLRMRPDPRACGRWLASLGGPWIVAWGDRVRGRLPGRDRRTGAGGSRPSRGGVSGGH